MLRFSWEIGQPVRSADGTHLGVVRDLVIDLDATEPVVRHLVVGTRRQPLAVVDWQAVTSFEHTLVQLGATTSDTHVVIDSPHELPLRHGELLVGRDVLDTQVVDISGSRLARVADVLLTRLPDDRLLVGAVDVSVGAVCRRLGLRRLADRLAEEAIAWDSLHLTSTRGHQVQLRTSKSLVHRLDERELAMLLSRVSVSAGVDVLAAVEPAQAAAALTRSHSDLASSLLAALDHKHLEPALKTLPDEHADRLRELVAAPRRRRALRHRQRRNLTPRRPRQPATPTEQSDVRRTDAP